MEGERHQIIGNIFAGMHHDIFSGSTQPDAIRVTGKDHEISDNKIGVTIDDKYVPVYRIIWISAVPHFCGSEDCQHEGDYEVRLEQGESVWASQSERDTAIDAVELWHGEVEHEDEEGLP